MHHNPVDNPGGEASNVVHGGELAWGKDGTGIRIDWERQADIHVHVVQPVVVRLKKKKWCCLTSRYEEWDNEINID